MTEIKKSLEDSIELGFKKYASDIVYTYDNYSSKTLYTKGAHFGHSLAMEEIERLKQMPGMFHATMCIEQQEQLLTAQKENEVLRETVEFYSDTGNFYWAQTDQDNIYMFEGEVKDNPNNISDHEPLCKRAREALSKLKGMGNEG